LSTRGVFFTAFLLVVTGVLTAQALTLAPGSRLAPLWVVLPTLAMLFLTLVLDTTSSFSARLRTIREDTLFGTPGQVDARLRGSVADNVPEDRRPREIRMVVWGGTLIGLVYAFGFFWAAPLYLALYLRAEAGLTWQRAVLAAAIAGGLFYAVFGLALDLTFPRGLLQ